MNEDEKRPWFSWAPNMPRAAILALLADLNFLGGWWFNQGPPANLSQSLTNLTDELFAGPPIARFTGMAVLLQLNIDAIYMILTMRRNHWEKEQAVAKAKAEAKAAGQSEANAAARAWYEAWQRDPNTAPPPPFLNGNESNHNSDSGYAL